MLRLASGLLTAALDALEHALDLAERQAESDIAVLSLAGTVAELAARLVKALS